MVMVWLEGGQGEVRGACAPLPPPPTTPQIAPPGPPPHQHPELPHLDPPPTNTPNCPTWTPPPTDPPGAPPPQSPSLNPPPLRCPPPPPPPPPPQGASGQQLVGGVALLELLRFGDHTTSMWDCDAERFLGEMAPPQPQICLGSVAGGWGGAHVGIDGRWEPGGVNWVSTTFSNCKPTCPSSTPY